MGLGKGGQRGQGLAKKYLAEFQPVQVILRAPGRPKDLPYTKRIIQSPGLPQNDTAFAQVIFRGPQA